MKTHLKVLAFIYMVSVVILLALEFSQFKKVDKLRAEIGESHRLISGQDEGVRLELDYRRFRDRLYSYVRMSGHETASGGNRTSHDDVLVAFDIFWSRVFQINSATVGLEDEQVRNLEPILNGLKRTMRQIEPYVQNLEPGDLDKQAIISKRLDPYGAILNNAAAKISHLKRLRAVELQDRLETVLMSMDNLLTTSALGAGLLLSLFGAEAYRARREERKTRTREARVRFLAEHDPLTGLANRAFLNQKMCQYMRDADEDGQGFHLLLLDLDKFKNVNDTYGHPMGDRLLKKAAARLLRIFASTDDIVARLGGDEFAILTKSSTKQAAALSLKVIDALSAVFTFGDLEVRISTSIGISSFPSLSGSSDDLMRDADLALYAAKNNGRATYRFYERDMGVAIQHRMQLEADLRRAMLHEDGGLEVYYQPQVNLAEQSSHAIEHHEWQITGAEALVRWFHPERGHIPPMEFIEIAEEAGIIDDLSDWIIRQACDDAVQWHQAGHRINLSVNLSPLQLNNPNLPNEILSHLDQCGFDPNYLTLEITESADVQDTKAAARMLSTLADRGISLAMDDFGTGYSNLGYLNSLPLNILKIDRSFISGIEQGGENCKLVLGVINLAHGMGLKVVAEGIETEEQLAFLRDQNCTIGQGYLFGRPVNKLKMFSRLRHQRLSEPRAQIRCIA
ncbi:bifunctional diguanylate cyclase/phosphodiesterase [Cohaesibacter sp. CAU 1516]|uniref:putative bifunctional diguanylate cyclase/phosphodiesterase n=1 Tax=Cohaesibacter sp. CAU 1516 TaxID=2576038 RepID=UPI0010FE2693|nr:bifunctional diguanylate cyclase/phosphodiesterase [Cohaesibacter sp. CAU 1516]TLP45659.1 bifunctional diguanylate cyclase/phosphodiesterase [Cohaesibacter sp. CAU 1516]